MEPCLQDDRQFPRVGAFKNSTGIATRKAPRVRNGRFIAYEPAFSDEFPSVIDGRDAMLRRKCNKPATALEQEWIGTNEKQPSALLDDQAEARFEIEIARGWDHE